MTGLEGARPMQARRRWFLGLPAVLLAGCLPVPGGNQPSPSPSPTAVEVREIQVSGIRIAVPKSLQRTYQEYGSWARVFVDEEGQARVLIGQLIGESTPEPTASPAPEETSPSPSPSQANTDIDQASLVLSDLLAIQLPSWRRVDAFRTSAGDLARVTFAWVNDGAEDTGTAWLVRVSAGFLPVVVLGDDPDTFAAVEQSLMEAL